MKKILTILSLACLASTSVFAFIGGGGTGGTASFATTAYYASILDNASGTNVALSGTMETNTTIDQLTCMNSYAETPLTIDWNINTMLSLQILGAEGVNNFSVDANGNVLAFGSFGSDNSGSPLAPGSVLFSSDGAGHVTANSFTALTAPGYNGDGSALVNIPANAVVGTLPSTQISGLGNASAASTNTMHVMMATNAQTVPASGIIGSVTNAFLLTFGFGGFGQINSIPTAGNLGSYFPITGGIWTGNNNYQEISAPLDDGTYTNFRVVIGNPIVGVGTNVFFVVLTNDVEAMRLAISPFIITPAQGSNVLGSFKLTGGTNMAVMIITNNSAAPVLNLYYSWRCDKY